MDGVAGDLDFVVVDLLYEVAELNFLEAAGELGLGEELDGELFFRRVRFAQVDCRNVRLVHPGLGGREVDAHGLLHIADVLSALEDIDFGGALLAAGGLAEGGPDDNLFGGRLGLGEDGLFLADGDAQALEKVAGDGVLADGDDGFGGAVNANCERKLLEVEPKQVGGELGSEDSARVLAIVEDDLVLFWLVELELNEVILFLGGELLLEDFDKGKPRGRVVGYLRDMVWRVSSRRSWKDSLVISVPELE